MRRQEDYCFLEEWPNSDIEWWNKNRNLTNRLIREFTAWQIEEDFDLNSAQKLRSKLIHGLQIISKDSPGPKEDIKKMLGFVEKYLK